MLSFARKRLEGTSPAFVFVIITGVLAAGTGIIVPLFSKIFIDYILSGKNPEWLGPLVTAMLLTLAFKFVIEAIQGVYWLKIEGGLAVRANASFMWHVLRLPVQFFMQRFAGDIASRQASNESIASTLMGHIAPIFINVLLLVLYLAAMLRYSLVLSLIAIGAAVANMLILKLVAQKLANMSRVMERDAGRLAGVTFSGFEMIETIKAAGAESGFFGRWAGYFAKHGNTLEAFSRANLYYNMIPPLLQQMANIAVLSTGVYLILDGKFTIGMLIAFQGFLYSFLSPVNEFVGLGQSFIEMRSRMERVEDVMSYRTDVPDDGDLEGNATDNNEGAADRYKVAVKIKQARKLSGEVKIDRITFGYNKLAAPLIEDFSMYLRPGGSVAFVGGSGSGKSTLAKLIAGLYAPWAGEIRFDGLRKDEIDREIFTASVAVVDQDIILFEDTIFNNITMWDRSIDEATVVAACRDACIHEDIMRREGGYYHVIREGGRNFSGGQRQRFEIARALAQEPSILILDEATSALDVKTEYDVMEAIRKRGISLIIIAHRLSTIRDCDEIIVLDNGKVVERGTHEELIRMGGKYVTLISN